MYADFLEDANEILDVDLSAAAKLYRVCAAEWRKLAEMALSDELPAFAETKALMLARYAAFARQDKTSLDGAMRALQALETPNNLKGWPLDEDATDALFTRLGKQINIIFETEQSALAAMKTSMP